MSKTNSNPLEMKRIFILFIALVCVAAPLSAQKRELGKVRTVVIDPGHGGNKPGARGKHIDEKDLVLSVAKKVGKLINDNYEDVKVIYTRTSDVDIDLSERAHIANRAKADLFISIHANSHPTSNPTGVETFVAGLSQSKANLEIAKKENADILLENDYKNNADYQGFDPNSPESYVLFAMYQNAYRDKSLTFAQYIQNQYKNRIVTIDRGVKQAEFMVLYKTTMPSVLTEIGFISNPKEEAYMMSEEGQNTIAQCIVKAFAMYKAAEESEPVPDLTFSVRSDAQQANDGRTGEITIQPEGDSGQVAPQQTVSEGKPATITPVHSVEIPTKPAVQKPETPKDPNEGKPYVVEKKEPAKPAPDQVAYRIQFMTLTRILEKGDPDLRGIDDFDHHKQGQYYYYLTGKFAKMSDATEYLNVVRAKGFKDAMLVAYLKGSRISLQQARKMTENQ